MEGRVGHEVGVHVRVRLALVPLELARLVLVVVGLVKVGVVALAIEEIVLVRHDLEVVLERGELLR